MTSGNSVLLGRQIKVARWVSSSLYFRLKYGRYRRKYGRVGHGNGCMVKGGHVGVNRVYNMGVKWV